MEQWVLLPVECNVSSGECFVTFPDELLSSLGWKEGTTLIWTVNEDNTVTVHAK